MIRDFLIRFAFGRHRNIFTYWDGRKIKRADPMVLFRRMSEHPEFDAHGDFVRLKSANNERRSTAIGHLAAVARDVFEIPPYDGKAGLTEQELLHLFGKFNQDMDALKKNTFSSRVPSPSTESKTTEPTTPDDNSMNGSLDSGSMPEKD